MNKLLKVLPLAMLSTSLLTSCGDKADVVIYTAHEENRIQLFNRELQKQFPKLKIQVVGMTTGKLMAELQARGTRSACDIFVGIEITNAEILLKGNPNLFADLSDYDTSHYVDEVLTYQSDITLADGTIRKGHKKYHIQDKEAGCIVYSKSRLQELGKAVPTSYEDLKSFPANSIIMPNPKSSGTGYYFYNGLASVSNKETALSYFRSINPAIKEWSSSGSGPVKGVDKKEIAVGLGMHFQAVEYANKNSDIGITYFAEGSPYTLYTMGMVNGKQKNSKVKEVYDYFFNHVNYLDNSEIVPETIYKSQFALTPTVPNWKSPEDAEYGSVGYTAMKNLLDPNFKQSMLDSWNL